MINIAELYSDPDKWLQFFERYSDCGTINKIPGYGEKLDIECMGLNGGIRLSLVTETETLRQRVEISPLTIGEIGIGDGLLMIVNYGDYRNDEKLPVGHIYLEGSRSWEDESMLEALTLAANDKVIWNNCIGIEEEITTKDQVIIRRYTLTEIGMFEKLEIVEGPGIGRVTVCYYPNNLDVYKLVSEECYLNVDINIGLGFGIVVEKGDCKDKMRSEPNSTFYCVNKFDIVENKGCLWLF